jgi:hypothetical protein
MRIGRRLQLNNLSSKRIIGVLTLAAVTSLACARAQTGPVDSTDTTESSDPGSSGYIAIPAQPMFALNGFGTLEQAHASERYGDYVFDNLQPSGIGRSRNWSGDIDSRLGMQMTANFNSQWSAVLQIVSEYRWDDTYAPFINWANVKYQVTPDISVRVGRIALASFLASDSRKIGFSNITARPPVEVYSLLALQTSDGIDAVYRTHFGDVTDSTTLLYGKATVTNTRGIEVHSTDVRGIFNTLEFGATTLHAAFQERNVDNQNPPLGKFMSVGANYDPGDWFASAEWVKAINNNAKSLKIPRVAWDMNGGRRFGAFAPYVTVSALCPEVNTGTTPIAQRSYATGIRWDFARNMDLKTEIDHVHLGDGSYGVLLNVAQVAPKGGQFNVASIVFDFIF